MKLKILFWFFVANFSLTIVVAAVVTFLWSLLAHGAGSIDWEVSVAVACAVASALVSVKAQELKDR